MLPESGRTPSGLTELDAAALGLADLAELFVSWQAGLECPCGDPGDCNECVHEHR